MSSNMSLHDLLFWILITLVPVGGAVVLWVCKAFIRQEISPLAKQLQDHRDEENARGAAMAVQFESIAGDGRVNDLEHADFERRIRGLERLRK